MIFFPVGALSQEISIRPIAFGMYRSTGDWWQPEKSPVLYLGGGIRGEFEWNDWAIRSEFVNTRYYGLTEIPNRFSPEQGLSWQQHATGKADEFDTDYTTMYVSYQRGSLLLEAGKYGLNWGPARESAILSAKPPPVPRFGFMWQVMPWLRFSYTHGQLHSGLVDSLRSATSPSLFRSRVIIRNRYHVAHRLEITLPWGLTVGGTEAIVYGDRGLELIYTMPFIAFWSAQHFLGDLDNTLLSLDLTWLHPSGLSLFGVFLMDEWMPQLTFNTPNRNWFGWQYGLRKKSLLVNNDLLLMEGIWTDHRIYRHRFPVNDYYSHNYPVGHWIGPHAQALMAIYQLPMGNGIGQVRALRAKRGELTDQMINDQYLTLGYDRYSGETEQITSFRFSVFWPVWEQTWIEVGVSNIDWINAGFKPNDPGKSTAGNISKWSFQLGFYSHFGFSGYDISLLQDN